MFYNFKYLNGELLINTDYILSITCEDTEITIVSKPINKEDKKILYHLQYKNHKQAIEAYKDCRKALDDNKTTFIKSLSNIDVDSAVNSIKKKINKVSQHITEELSKEPTGFIFTVDFNNVIVKIPRGTIKDVQLINGEYKIMHNGMPLMKALGNNYGHLLYYKEEKE